MLGKVSLNQILGVGSTPEVVHGMLYDGPGEGGRYVVGDPGTVSEQDGFEEFDGGDPDQLIATARWLFEKHPAERYGLVLWSHGTGWQPEEIAQVAAEARPDAAAKAESNDRAGTPGSYALFRSTLRALQRPPARAERAILFDDGTGHSLDTLELQRVMDTLAETVGQPLELLGMDACLMASLEVAYQIKSSVRAFVASAELVPGHSWPYSAIYGALRNDPEMSGTALARLAVEKYVQFYTGKPSRRRRRHEGRARSRERRRHRRCGSNPRRRAHAGHGDAYRRHLEGPARHADERGEGRKAETQQVRLSSLGPGIAGGRHRREPQRV